VIYINYLVYVLKHKWFVFCASIKYGVIWRGLLHDMSKFLPSEFIPYAQHFYGKNPLEEANETDEAFMLAWLKHCHRNPHHWQYWLQGTHKKRKAYEMPIKYRKEMLADWEGAGKARGNPDTVVEWYQKNKSSMILGKETRAWIETNLEKP